MEKKKKDAWEDYKEYMGKEISEFKENAGELAKHLRPLARRKHRIHRLKVRKYPLGRNLINW